MGGSASRQVGTSISNKSNGKKILEILIQICSSWGFSNKAENVKNMLIKELNNQGYDVNYDFEPMKGGKGEFFIFLLNDGQKKCVFANNKTIGDSNTIVGMKINDKNLQDIIKNII